MVTPSWFVTALEARNNIVKDIAVHSEITGIEREVLLAVQRGDYEVNITDDTLMTESSPDPILSFTADPASDTLTVTAHNFRTGDLVSVSSTGELPPPLLSTSYYYVIYIDPNTIKLASSRANAINNRPVAIDFGQGVSSVTVTNPGTGYLSAPRVTFVGGDAEVAAQARAVLQRFGPASTVSLLTEGSGFTDIPNAIISAVGSGALLGNSTFKVVLASVLFGGSGYNVNDLLFLIDGAGTPAVFRVSSVDGGVVTGATVVDPGNYSILPTLSGGITTTSGTGSGCSFVLSMGISSIGILNSGIQYVNSPLLTISGGDGAGATATATISGGGVIAVVVSNPGAGYTSQPTIGVTTGSGATASVRIKPTSVSSIQLTNNGGASYVSVPSVVVAPLGSGATVASVFMKAVSVSLVSPGVGYRQGDQLLTSGGIGTASAAIEVLRVDAAGHILTFALVNPGQYSVLPILSSNNSVGGSGIGASWNLVMGIAGVSLVSGGSGYTTNPLVTFQGGGGEGANGYATLTGGSVSGVVISDPGTGYTAIPTAVISAGTGATAQATLVPTTVSTISVTDGGSGYVSPPQVTIVGGGGDGATAEAVLSGDAVDFIVVTNPGSGYTDVPAVLIDGDATGVANLTPTPLQAISLITGGAAYTHVPAVVVSGAATARAIMVPTSIQSVEITAGGQNYVSNPVLNFTPGIGQLGATISPVNRVNRSFSIDLIQILDSGSAYASAPAVMISAPNTATGTPATATATLGSGTGNFSIVAYQPSRDYFMVWKQQCPSNELLTRPINDQMQSVVKYFTDLGYTINRYTNPSTGNTLAWSVKW
jgi:hypothetical protein